MVTRNGWTFVGLAATLLVLGTWLQFAELVALGAGLLLCVGVATVWMARRPPIEVHRDIPRQVQEGLPARGILTVTNVGRRRTPPILAVESFGIAGQRSVDSVTVALRGVAAGADDSVEYPLPTGRRGRYTVGPLVVGNADPLRLAGGSQRYGDPASLCVHPRVHRVHTLPTGQLRDVDGSRSRRSPEGGDDFRGLRDYEPGDDRRMIHWPSTAKVGALRVREMDVTSEPRLIVVLDTSAASYSDDEAFEDAVRIAASLVMAGADAGHPTEFRATSGAHATLQDGRGRDEALDELASVVRRDDHGLALLATIATGNTHGMSIGIVTDQPVPSAITVLGQVGPRFGRVSIVQVGRRADRVPIRIGGISSMMTTTSTEFARTWNARFQ